MHAAKQAPQTALLCRADSSVWDSIYLFSGGHAPTENSLTRVQLRRVAAKPRRSAEPNWLEEPKTPTVLLHRAPVRMARNDFEPIHSAKIYLFSWPPEISVSLFLGLGNGDLLRNGAFPAKSSILWEPFIDFIDFG